MRYVFTYSSSSEAIFFYDSSFDSLLFNLTVTIHPSFLGLSNSSLLNYSTQFVDNLFNLYIGNTFLDSCLVFADEWLKANSAGFTIYIPKYHIFAYSDVLITFASSFFADGHTVIQALYFIRYHHSLYSQGTREWP